MALYRKYRPATFAEVVGQEHVTEPLCTSLDSGRINHAYLFSGPRGCGKTSSARILARSLNCVEGPTSTPCGVCDSCVALAPGGPGTLDVTELDAATHNGVEDMRELRDRAFYAPAESRYRVFIIDEAHMISSAGFNALLKIVEEPPEHLIFIFATTEPEKLLQTIRSRTHNYPFRLLTPPAMRGLLERICGEEGVVVEDAVYPLVIRAGGGSPRDSLSVMDQLLAGAGPEGVTYRRAVALLGVTDSTLIDRAVDALSVADQAGLFSVVSDVIDAGHDPRRFATDLLDRFRDLLVVQSVPDAFDTGLVDAPVDQRDVLDRQAGELGSATLTRCAALVNEGLMQMRGATSPRLLLEILCARMALPAAGMTVEALAQRVEALESGQVSPGAGAAGGAGASGGAVGRGAGVSGEDAPSVAGSTRYVRKSRRQGQGTAAETPAQAQAPAQSPVDASAAAGAPSPASAETSAQPSAEPATVTGPATPPETPAAEAPEQSGQPVAAEAVAASVPEPAAESAAVDDGMSEAQRAREIMRRNRRRAAEETTGQSPAPTGTPGATPAEAPGAGTAHAPNAETAQAPNAGSAPEPTQEVDQHPTSEQAPEPASGPAEQPVEEQAPQQAQEPTREPTSGPAQQPAEEQAPEPAREQAPEQASEQAATGAPAQAASSPASSPVERWGEILEALRGIDLSAWIAARDATPAAGDPSADGTPSVVLHHHTGALANFINDPGHAAAYASAAQQVTGAPVTVHAVVGGRSASPEVQTSPGKAEAAAPAAPAVPEADQPPAGSAGPSDQAPAGSAGTSDQGGQQGFPAGSAGTSDQSGQQKPPAEPVAPTPGAPTDPVAIALARAKAQEGSPAGKSVPATAPQSENQAQDQARNEPQEQARNQAQDPAQQQVNRPRPQTGVPASDPSAASTPTAASGRNGAGDGGQELTGWRARMARNSTRQAEAATAADNGFNGVPLPEEPGEPWDDGPGAVPGDPQDAYGQAPGAASAPYDRAAEAEEALAQLDDPSSGNLDHRSALEIAGELLEKHLGAERTR